jgi:hypothetical protein
MRDEVALVAHRMLNSGSIIVEKSIINVDIL